MADSDRRSADASPPAADFSTADGADGADGDAMPAAGPAVPRDDPTAGTAEPDDDWMPL